MSSVTVKFCRPSRPSNVRPYHRLSTVGVALEIQGRVSLSEFRLCLLRAEDTFSFACSPGDYSFEYSPKGRLIRESHRPDLKLAPVVELELAC